MTQFTKTIKKWMGSSADYTRGPSAVEHFMHTEYHAGSSVKEEITSHMKNGEYTQQNCMSTLRMEAAKSMTARVDKYVKKMELEARMECECHAKKVKAKLSALCNPNGSTHLQYIEGLGTVVGQLLKTIQETTGWYGSIYLGGPDPCVGGEVHVFSFHHEKGSTGLNFRKTLPDHHACIVEPFTTFLKGGFTTQPLPQLLPQQPDTNSILPDLAKLLPLDSQLSHSITPSVDFGHSAMQYPHLFSAEQNMIPNEIHQSSQDYTALDQAFDESLGLLSFSSKPFAMSDNTLYIIAAEDNIKASQQSLLMPFYPSHKDPDSPISSWNREHVSGRIQLPVFSPPLFLEHHCSSCIREPIEQHREASSVLSPCFGGITVIPPSSIPPPVVPSLPPVPASPLMTPTLPLAAPTLPPMPLDPSEAPAVAPTPQAASEPPQPPPTTICSLSSQITEPPEDILNHTIRRSCCVHVPSTHLMETNNIGTQNRARKPHKSAL
ncbi:hypothetical protein BDR05DRAFT_951287 [Suillus weaverae]|nr:hypothetical protein BDR05DRAFT_951287 [Suillus weaverae]